MRQRAGSATCASAGAARSTLYPDRPPGSVYRRTFGAGYYEKEEPTNGLRASQTIFAPFGTDPVLLSQVVLKSTTERAETVRYVEYRGTNPEVVPPGFPARARA
jgi:hypothetical protein